MTGPSKTILVQGGPGVQKESPRRCVKLQPVMGLQFGSTAVMEKQEYL